MHDDLNMPWYAATLKTILQTSGPIAVVALLLVWYLMTTLTVSMGRVSDQIKANHDELISARVEMKEFAAKQGVIESTNSTRNDSIVKILRQTCVNAAPNMQARQGCYE